MIAWYLGQQHEQKRAVGVEKLTPLLLKTHFYVALSLFFFWLSSQVEVKLWTIQRKCFCKSSRPYCVENIILILKKRLWGAFVRSVLNQRGGGQTARITVRRQRDKRGKWDWCCESSHSADMCVCFLWSANCGVCAAYPPTGHRLIR